MNENSINSNIELSATKTFIASDDFENKQILLNHKLNLEECLYSMKVCNDLLLVNTAYEQSLKYINLINIDKSNNKELNINNEILLSDIWNNYVKKNIDSWNNLVRNLYYLKEKIDHIKNKSYFEKNVTNNLSIEDSTISKEDISKSNTRNNTINKYFFQEDLNNSNIYNYNKLINLIEREISSLEEKIEYDCLDIVDMADKMCNHFTNIRQNIFFCKLKADFMSYYSEIINEEDFANVLDTTHSLYQDCFDKSLNLENEDYLYLSIAFNYSSFLSKILNSTEKAYEIASKAYYKATSVKSYIKLSELSNKSTDIKINSISYQEFKIIKYKLESKLVIWKTELLDFDK